jgi:formate dehydrogenase iron-sulfur subunit
MSKAILVDTTKCIGCGACAAACKVVNGLPLEGLGAGMQPSAHSLSEEELVAFAQSHGEVGGVLSARVLNVVEAHGEVFVRRFCMHCQDPTCASVCPVGALRKTAAGPVVYDADRCMGCRYCMMACPFGIPRYEWNVLFPKVAKCTMCAPRQERGLPPACVAVCPVQASIFGERDELLQEAEKRVSENPSRYIPHIYGKQEVGGTSVLYLSAVPLATLGFPAGIPYDPLPMYTYRVLAKIPNIVTAGAFLLGGIWWITNRREEVARAEENSEPASGMRGKGRRSKDEERGNNKD